LRGAGRFHVVAADLASIDEAALEPEVLAVGREIASRLPGSTRNPLRALDERAMRATARPTTWRGT
jgi:hypothetical protein